MRILLAVLAALLPASALAAVATATCKLGVCSTQMPSGTIPKTGKALVVFGDSFSDIGNAYEASKQTFPTAKNGYWYGRFTNGYGWSEYAVNNTGSYLINFAYPGSCANDPTTVYGQTNAGLPFKVPTLPEQVQKALKDYGKSLNGKNTAFIWSGSNDISNLLQANFGFIPNVTIDNTTLFAKAATIAPAIAKAVEDLIDYGFTKRVVISNIQPIDEQPIWFYAITLSGYVPPEYQAYGYMTIKSLVAFVNAQMEVQLARLQKKYAGRAVIEGYDAHALYQGVIDDGAAYDIKEDKWSCIIGATPMGPLSPTESETTTLNSTCKNAPQYLFWDSSHPTTAFYEVLAKDLQDALGLLPASYMGEQFGKGANSCDAETVYYACADSVGKSWHPCDRTKYLQCNNGTGVVKSCKATEIYDIATQKCMTAPKQAPETIGRSYYDNSVFTIAHFMVAESDRAACKNLCKSLSAQVKTLPLTMHSRCTFGQGNGTHYEMVVTERTADATSLILQFTVTLPLQFQFLSLAHLQSLWVLADAPGLVDLKPYFGAFPFAPIISFFEVGLGALTRF